MPNVRLGTLTLSAPFAESGRPALDSFYNCTQLLAIRDAVNFDLSHWFCDSFVLTQVESPDAYARDLRLLCHFFGKSGHTGNDEEADIRFAGSLADYCQIFLFS